MSFKVGDKVKILWGKTGYIVNGYEDTGIVKSVEGLEIEVYDFSKSDSPFSLGFREDQLKLIKTMDLKIGDKVKGVVDREKDYTGEVFSIDGNEATIKRDDGITGNGDFISDDYGRGWIIEKKEDGSWGANGSSGELTIISSPETQKPDELEITLPPKIKELLIKNLPELVEKGYLTDEFEITPKGQNALSKIIKLFLVNPKKDFDI